MRQAFWVDVMMGVFHLLVGGGFVWGCISSPDMRDILQVFAIIILALGLAWFAVGWGVKRGWRWAFYGQGVLNIAAAMTPPWTVLVWRILSEWRSPPTKAWFSIEEKRYW